MRKFSVYIIESPKPKEIFNGTQEGAALCQSLKLSGINAISHLVTNIETFNDAFGESLLNFIKNSDYPPIIHISAHGNQEGIELSSGDFIKWEDLKQFLIPLNSSMNKIHKHGIFLCMSTCKGFSACKMAMSDGEFPFSAVIGSSNATKWNDYNVGFTVFYHLFSKGLPLPEIIEKMKASSGENGFEIISAEKARELYKNALDEIQKTKLIKNIEVENKKND